MATNMDGGGKKPVPGEFYRHFKGNLYQIRMLARDAGNGKELVVYQAMFPPYSCLVLSLAAFLSLVDKEKYPQAEQKRIFEKTDIESFRKTEGKRPENPSEESTEDDRSIDSLTDEELERVLCDGNIEKYIGTRITEEELKRRGLMLLLDAESFRKKRQIFMGMGAFLDQVLLNNIAVTLDLVLKEEDEEGQYDAILKCLGALEHYEGGRLR